MNFRAAKHIVLSAESGWRGAELKYVGMWLSKKRLQLELMLLWFTLAAAAEKKKHSLVQAKMKRLHLNENQKQSFVWKLWSLKTWNNGSKFNVLFNVVSTSTFTAHMNASAECANRHVSNTINSILTNITWLDNRMS